jgi:hypothetical protein
MKINLASDWRKSRNKNGWTTRVLVIVIIRVINTIEVIQTSSDNVPKVTGLKKCELHD